MAQFSTNPGTNPGTDPGTDPTQRFSNRVDNYVRYRPCYPVEVLSVLSAETGLTAASAIADMGSGTGISTQLFLDNGNTVFAVEPNSNMRQAAEQSLQQYANFHSVAGSAEATHLPAQSVDYVVAAQAFHWFQSQQARHEFMRILKPGGWAVLMWNARRADASPFLRGYERLLLRYGINYPAIHHQKITVETLKPFFSSRGCELRTLDYERYLAFDELKGYLLSCSYAPTEEHGDFKPMVTALRKLFEQYNHEGKVCLAYDTKVYFGKLTE